MVERRTVAHFFIPNGNKRGFKWETSQRKDIEDLTVRDFKEYAEAEAGAKHGEPQTIRIWKWTPGNIEP